jgi:tetratricopeptide (TPR) repeat protein
MGYADLFADQFAAALAAAEDETASPMERAEMLMEIAMGMQLRPKDPGQLRAAAELCDKALAICPETEVLLRARITARKATALQAVPGEDAATLQDARAAYEAARPVLEARGSPEEVAELEMNLGLVLQTLAGFKRARITDAISAYQRALRVFDKTRFPQEFAILQNNLATAFLSIPLADERGRMREALAVQAFEEGLRVVNIVDHPNEYAMLQNNLGNALQYAYTLTNKANCLQNLPDNPEAPENGNRHNLVQARGLYVEAREIFTLYGDNAKAAIVAEAAFQLERELMNMAPANNGAMPAASA